MIVVRYADDAVLGFEHKEEAERFLRDLRDRLAKFGLELQRREDAADRIWAARDGKRKGRGEGKPETFDFLDSRT